MTSSSYIIFLLLRINTLTFSSYIAYQYVNFVDPNGTYEWSWRGVIMTAIPKPREDFTIFDVICDYTLNKINFMKTSGTY